jgi:hypothetical protein
LVALSAGKDHRGLNANPDRENLQQVFDFLRLSTIGRLGLRR